MRDGIHGDWFLHVLIFFMFMHADDFTYLCVYLCALPQ